MAVRHLRAPERHVLGEGRTGNGGIPEQRHIQAGRVSRTARIICDGQIYIKNERPAQYAASKEIDEITAASFYLEGDSVNIQA